MGGCVRIMLITIGIFSSGFTVDPRAFINRVSMFNKAFFQTSPPHSKDFPVVPRTAARPRVCSSGSPYQGEPRALQGSPGGPRSPYPCEGRPRSPPAHYAAPHHLQHGQQAYHGTKRKGRLTSWFTSSLLLSWLTSSHLLSWFTSFLLLSWLTSSHILSPPLLAHLLSPPLTSSLLLSWLTSSHLLSPPLTSSHLLSW